MTCQREKAGADKRGRGVFLPGWSAAAHHLSLSIVLTGAASRSPCMVTTARLLALISCHLTLIMLLLCEEKLVLPTHKHTRIQTTLDLCAGCGRGKLMLLCDEMLNMVTAV